MLITGAGSGLGRLTAERALDQGWRVAALDINTKGLEQLSESPKLLLLSCDITDSEAVQAAVSRCEKELGPIFRLVNAAAIMPLAEVLDQSPAQIQKIMSINYGGMVNISHAVMPLLLERGAGEFVSYASMAGHWPIMFMGAYNASKHAVTAHTEVLYHETRGRGVRIVCVCPPIVATPLLEQARQCWPKLFDIFPPITPESVINAVERKLRRRNGLWVFPGPMTAMSYRLRRWMPNTLWQLVHFVEKR